MVQALAGGTPGTSGSLSKLRWCQLQTKAGGKVVQHGTARKGCLWELRQWELRWGDVGAGALQVCTAHAPRALCRSSFTDRELTPSKAATIKLPSSPTCTAARPTARRAAWAACARPAGGTAPG